MKTKLVVGPSILAIRFVEKSLLSTILGFTSHWDNKHYNKYFNQKIVNLTSTDKIHLKADGIDGSVVNGKRELKLFSFGLDKKSGYKVFSEPEAIQYKRKQIYLFSIL